MVVIGFRHFSFTDFWVTLVTRKKKKYDHYQFTKLLLKLFFECKDLSLFSVLY